LAKDVVSPSIPISLDSSNIIRLSNEKNSLNFDTYFFIIGSIENDLYQRINFEYSATKEDSIISQNQGDCSLDVFQNGQMFYSIYKSCFETYLDKRLIARNSLSDFIQNFKCNKEIFYKKLNQMSFLDSSNFTSEVFNTQYDQILELSRLETTSYIDNILRSGYNTTFKFFDNNYPNNGLIKETIYGMVSCEICFINYYCETLKSSKVQIFEYIPSNIPDNNTINNNTNYNNTVNNNTNYNNTINNSTNDINNQTNNTKDNNTNNNISDDNKTYNNTTGDNTNNNGTHDNNTIDYITHDNNSTINSTHDIDLQTKNNTDNNTINNSTYINNTITIKNIIVDNILNVNITINPLNDNTQAIQEFSNLTSQKKIEKIEMISSKLDIFDSLIDDQEHDLKINKTKSDLIKNLTHSDKIDIIQDTIALNNFLSITNCTKFENSKEKNECEIKVKETQKKITSTISIILNCNEVFKVVFGSENPEKNFILSALSLFYSSSNYNSFTNSSLVKINDITQCLIDESSKIINKISQNNTNSIQNENLKNDFMNIISTTTSNMINIVKKTTINELNNTANYNDFKNSSLVINSNTIQVKSIIEQNAVNLMRLEMNKAFDSTDNSGLNARIDSNDRANSTNKTSGNKTFDSFSLRTENIHYFAQRSKFNFFKFF